MQLKEPLCPLVHMKSTFRQKSEQLQPQNGVRASTSLSGGGGGEECTLYSWNQNTDILQLQDVWGGKKIWCTSYLEEQILT